MARMTDVRNPPSAMRRGAIRSEAPASDPAVKLARLENMPLLESSTNLSCKCTNCALQGNAG
jgi:hypothetical protein